MDRFQKAEADLTKFRERLEREFYALQLPKEARDLIWEQAWDLGHSFGVHAVRNHYDDFISIAFAARPDLRRKEG
ncbi:hypothetical protein [Roseibium album]|uniref:hypothetical protein n=1 Tax=Roseibium album TaxID=311410 RepID=UPI00391DC35D